tara:strand:+ start:785 stop:1990 length:1206 start_codon:yes stop_codon:yes gene_type:complete
MKYRFFFISIVTITPFYSQGVINGHIEQITIWFENVEWNMPLSVCDWNNSDPCSWIEGSGEFVLKAGASDVPNRDGVSGYNYATCQTTTDGDGVFNTMPDYYFYNQTYSSPYETSMSYVISFNKWEEDCDDGCTISVGDDCEYSSWQTYNLFIPSCDKYPAIEYVLSTISGSLNADLKYRYQYESDLGRPYNRWDFGTIDAGGCIINSTHCNYTKDDAWAHEYYKFTISNSRSLKFDWTNQSGTVNVFPYARLYKQGVSGEITKYSSTSKTAIYLNLSPGTYELNLIEDNGSLSDGRYKLLLQNADISDVIASHIWTGAKDVNWFNQCNWSTGHVPDKDNDVVIENTSNLPRIYSSGNASPDNANGYSAGQAHCNSIDIQSGAKVTVESPTMGTAKLNVNH